MRIHPTGHVLGIPLLSLLLLTGVQAPPQPQDPPEGAGADRVRVDRKKLHKELQGAWRLVEFHAPTLYPQARKDVGYCLFAGSSMSLEMHLGWMSDAVNVEAKTFQSGTHNFDLDDQGFLRTSSLIGAFVNRVGELQFESPGTSRTYKVTLSAGRLTLARTDGQTLAFERMTDSKLDRDFFGRKRRELPKADVEEPPAPKEDSEPPKESEPPKDDSEK